MKEIGPTPPDAGQTRPPRQKLGERLKQWAKRAKRLVRALGLAARDPRTPLLAKIVAVGVVGYALSPIDLIPDFIPVLGQLDDLILVPLGIWLAVSLVPDALWDEFSAQAAQDEGGGIE